jgi:adenylate kinase
VRAGTDLGQRAKRYLDEGELVPDDLVLAIVSDRVKRANPAGFILDGFPRTVEQARAADRLFAESGGPVDAVICLDVDRDESVRRLLARAGQEGRSDDQEPTIRHRLAVFDRMTKPLLQYYGDRGLVMAIDGERPIDTVTGEILDQLATRTSKR